MRLLQLVMILQATLFTVTKGFFISTRSLRTTNFNLFKMNPNLAAKSLVQPSKMSTDSAVDTSVKAPKRIRLRNKKKDSSSAIAGGPQTPNNVAKLAMDVAKHNSNPTTSSSESSNAISPQCKNVDMDVDNDEVSSTGSNEFNDLDISANTKKAIVQKLKYKTMTPVQTASIPIILEGKDVVVKGNGYSIYLFILISLILFFNFLCLAKTGTGKTIAFLVPAIDVSYLFFLLHRFNFVD